jgi:hypothetical protein
VAAAQATAAQATSVFKDRTRDAELRAAALGAGLVDLDLLPLIDKTGITVGDDGTVSGITEAIAKFKEKKPTYFGTPGAPPAPTPPRQSGSPVPPPAPGPTPGPTPVGGQSAKDYKASKGAAIASLRGVR